MTGAEVRALLREALKALDECRFDKLILQLVLDDHCPAQWLVDAVGEELEKLPASYQRFWAPTWPRGDGPRMRTLSSD